MAENFINSNKINQCPNLHIYKLRYIGKNSKIYDNIFKNHCDLDYLPIKNLPCVYFPFYYENVKVAKDFIKRLVDGINNYDIDNLLFNVSNISQDYQVYNSNSTFHIQVVIIIFWILLLFYILRYIYIKYNVYHLYFIISLSFLLLTVASLWALIVTSQNI
jgi:hypothetical protein